MDYSDPTTNFGFLVLERDLELLHGIAKHLEAIEDVVEDDDPPLLLFVLIEAILGIDQSHLL